METRAVSHDLRDSSLTLTTVAKSLIPRFFLTSIFLTFLMSASYGQSIRYVDATATGSGNGASWADAFTSVTEAIDASIPGDEIWVARGTYKEAIHFEKQTALYGGFTGTEMAREERDWEANPTILDATGLNERVVRVDSVNGTTIDGFTLTGAGTSGGANQIGPGGGIYYRSVDSATLANCTITGNRSDRDGGGIACDEAILSVSNCKIIGNRARSSGGAIYCIRADCNFTDCELSGNQSGSGGGINCRSSQAVLLNCRVTNNFAEGDGGGIFLRQSTLTGSRCIIANNSSGSSGGGLRTDTSNIALTHCTITGNRAAADGGGIYNDFSVPHLTNCILWNPGREVFNTGSSSPVITHSCVQGGFSGLGNLDAYPLFVHPPGEDFALQDGSPCINSGTDIALSFNGAAPDMGASESPATYAQGPTQHIPLLLHVNANAGKGGQGENWSNALQSISDALVRCSASDEIWVAEGTYYEDVNFEPGLALIGGFAGNETTRDQRDPGMNPTTIESPGFARSVITICQIENTRIEGFSVVSVESTQTGIACREVQSALLKDCRVYGQLFLSLSSPTVEICTISSGGVRCSYSNPTFLSSFITDNVPGIDCYSSNPKFQNCQITNNTRGIVCDSSDPTFTNCTLADNGGFQGQSMKLAYSSPTITNSIISTNQQHLVDLIVTQDTQSAPVITYSLVDASEGGEFNIDTDPLFVDPENGDYRLQPGSPCIDAGNPATEFNDGCLPPGQGTVRNDMGYTGGAGNCDVLTGSTVPTFTPTPTITPTPTPPCDSGYYVLDSYGGRHRVGNPTTITGSLYFGYVIARDLEKATVQVGQATGTDLVVLDGAGVAHFVEYPNQSIPQMFYFGDELNEFPQGRAVDLELPIDNQGLWVLTDSGGIYRAGSALDGTPVRVPNTDGFGLGWDVPIGPDMRAPGLEAPGGATLRAVSLVVVDEDENSIADGYVIIDSMGGRFHIDNEGNEFPADSSMDAPENSPQKLLDPIAYAWPFFKGLDIARDAELHSSQQGVILFDGWGGIHPVPVDDSANPVFFANNRDPENPNELITTVGMPYITAGFPPPGQEGSGLEQDAASIFEDLEFSAGCGNGFYTLDKFGGVFAFGAAREDPDSPMPPFSGSPYFFPNQLAESIEIFGGNETDFETDFGLVVTIDLPRLQEGARPLRLVRIPAGSFLMGARQGQVGADPDEFPRHEVVMGHDFYIGETEITQAQFRAITGQGCGPTCERPDFPQSFELNMSANSLLPFIDELRTQTGLPIRLPSEAEWEYACRAGSETRFHFGEYPECTGDCVDCENPANGIRLTDFMNYCVSPQGNASRSVATLLPNAFGLYDMHGSYWEWCGDSYHSSYENAPTDGSAWIDNDGTPEVIRGGVYLAGPDLGTSTSRFSEAAGHFGPIGLRVVWDLTSD